MEPPMTSGIEIASLRFVAAEPDQMVDGLLGWVALTLGNQIRLDGIAVRRTLAGRLALSYPARRDRSGRQHFYVRPLDDAARREIEREVFRRLGLREAAR